MLMLIASRMRRLSLKNFLELLFSYQIFYSFAQGAKENSPRKYLPSQYEEMFSLPSES